VLPDDGTLQDALLVCATELTTPDEIAAFASALQDELAGDGQVTGHERVAVPAGSRP
jgi:hypothetical protein